MYEDLLLSRAVSALQLDRGPRNAESPRKQRRQLVVGASIDRTSGEPDFQGAAVTADDFRASRPGLDVNGQDEGIAQHAQPVWHRLEKDQNELRQDNDHQRRQVD